MLDKVPDEGKFGFNLGGSFVCVSYKIYDNKKVKATFSYLGKLFEFEMYRWSRKGWSPFVLKFHQAYHDRNAYGTSTEAEDGTIVFDITPDQLNTIQVKATQDVFSYINQLLTTHQKMILDYCVWYRDKNPSPETYAEYIQLVACHCVVHSQFLEGNIPWQVVPFKIERNMVPIWI